MQKKTFSKVVNDQILFQERGKKTHAKLIECHNLLKVGICKNKKSKNYGKDPNRKMSEGNRKKIKGQ